MSFIETAVRLGLVSRQDLARLGGDQAAAEPDQLLQRLGLLTPAQVAQVWREVEAEDQRNVRSLGSRPADSMAEVYQQALQAESKRYGVSEAQDLESNQWWNQGRYRIERSLGEGGMGKVYLARDTQTNARVVLKLMKRPRDDTRSYINRFRREIHALRELDHPGIARLLDWGVEEREEASLPWFTTVYRAGVKLSDWVGERPTVPLRWALRCAAALGEAAGYAHERGFVHRDIKPENVIVPLPAGEAFLIDFGLVKVLLGEETFLQSSSAAYLGTPYYMSPEQVSGGPVGPWTDVYSLGGLLQWLLCGVPANPIRTGATFSELVQTVLQAPPSFGPWPHLDAELEALCHRAQSTDGRRRYPDGAAFARTVREYLDLHDRAPLHRLHFLEPAGRPPLALEGAGAIVEGAQFIRLVEGYALLADPGAAVTVNGQPPPEEALQHGDRIQAGSASLVYRRELA